jgi:uncharacterized protein
MTISALSAFGNRKPSLRSWQLLLAGLVILTNFGCQSTPTQPTPSVSKSPVTTARDAETLLASARTAEPHAAAVMYLDAARDLLKRGDTAGAKTALASVDATLLKRGARFRYEVTRAALALASGQAADAYAILLPLQPTDDGERRDRAVVLERAAAESGHVAEAAEMLMATHDASNEQELNDRIWSLLVQAPPMTIEARAASADDPTVRAWWRLASAVERAFDSTEQRAALATWQREFANHPAARVPPAALRRLTSGKSNVEHIALLLPLSGQLATAGRAVRDGFVSAFYRSGTLREISIYDTTSQPVSALYEQAILDGSDVIVGPLDKPNVSALNALPVRLAPALVLNHLSEGETPGESFYQFALAIEDEGQAIAERVADDRRSHLVVLRADQDWANRAATAFFARWPEAREAIASEGVIYDVKSLTETIARALYIDQSNERAKAITQLLGERVEFVPRRRQDVDAVVAFVDALQARALVPALAYYFASDVPVYTSSQAVQGLDRSALSELEGARVCQIPWKIGADPLRTEVETAFEDAGGVLASLYAFGVDAYRIVDRLDTMAGGPLTRVLGATGILTVGDDGRIRREPSWAIVRSGRLDALPMLMDSIQP